LLNIVLNGRIVTIKNLNSDTWPNKQAKPDFDSPWKKALESYFPAFMQLLFPKTIKKLGLYTQKMWGTALKFRFPIITIQDWQDKIDQLESNANLFTVIILAQLIAHNIDNPRQHYLHKSKIITLLYQRGYLEKDVVILFHLINWLLQLPEALELQLKHKVAEIEAELKMPYITHCEWFAKEEGEVSILLKLLKLKFGFISKTIENKIKSAEKSQLDDWLEKIFTAKSLASLLRLK
jgi:hypothetical protein